MSPPVSCFCTGKLTHAARQFSHSRFDETRSGVEAGSFDQNVGRVPHRANAAFPFTAGMSTDEFLLRISGGQLCQFRGRRFSRPLLSTDLEPRMLYNDSVVIRVQPNSGHIVFINASAKVIFPVRQFRIDRSHRNQFRAIATCVRQPLIHFGNIAMQNPFETSGPGLSDSRELQFLHKGIRIIEWQSAKRPAEEADVGIEDPEMRLFDVC